MLRLILRWNSEELRKEIKELQKMMNVQNTSEENAIYYQQLQGLQETKSLCMIISTVLTISFYSLDAISLNFDSNF